MHDDLRRPRAPQYRPQSHQPPAREWPGGRQPLVARRYPVPPAGGRRPPAPVDVSRQRGEQRRRTVGGAIDGARRARETAPADRPWRNAPTVVIPAVGEQRAERTQAGEEIPSTRLKEKRRRKDRQLLLVCKVTAVAVAVLTFLGAGAAWGMKTWFDSQFTEIVALDEGSRDILNAPAQLGDENFLIVGSDTRAGAKPGEQIGSEDKIPGARSDTVMVAHVPKDRGRAVLISFPRDLEIDRPACARWDPKTGDYDKADVVPQQYAAKLNTAYQVGGPACVTKVVQQITGLRMGHFVSINFNGFQDMVDAVGGVRVDVEYPIIDAQLGEVIPVAGPVTMDGTLALKFVRARKVAGDPTSDYGRIKRQQQFISALLGKTMSKDVLFDPGKLSAFVTAFAKATVGQNVGVDQLLTLAQSMKDLGSDSITYLTVPTVGVANERGNEELLEEETAAIFEALIDNEPLPGERGGATDAQDRVEANATGSR